MEYPTDQVEIRMMISRMRLILENNFTEDEREELMRTEPAPLNTICEILDAFKEAIGEEHYTSLSHGPAFAEILDRWLGQRARGRIDEIWKRMQEKLPEKELAKISKSDVEKFIILAATS